MSNTPDVRRSREQVTCPPSEAELLDSSQPPPTVVYGVQHGEGSPTSADASAAQEQSETDLAGSSAPSQLVADVPMELVNHPRYRVVGGLGKGGMGIVYKAEHRVMKRLVALKVIGTRFIADANAVARFRREVEAAAKLSHPNIVTAYDAEQAGNCHFLVMELVDGINFDQVLKRKGPLPLAFACDYMRQTALGLQHAHEHGMVHRDIKLQNLMLTRKGQVKILDFGLARFASENGASGSLTATGVLTGTPDFMAPEQAEAAHRADIRADIYSLGCTFYTLLTGRLPFPGNNYVEKIIGHLKREPAPLTAYRDDLPPELIQIVARMVAKDPAQRFQTPDEVAKALAPFRRAGGSTSGQIPVVSAKSKDSGPLSLALQESPTTNADVAEPLEDATTARPQPPSTQIIRTSKDDTRIRTPRTRTTRRRDRSHPRRSWRSIALLTAIAAIFLLSLGNLFLVLHPRSGAGGENAETAPLPSAAGMRDEEQGHVQIMSGDPNVRLEIRRGPKVVGSISPNHNRDIMLPPGEYEVQVVDGAPELRGFARKLSLARGDQRVVDVRREGILLRDGAELPPPPFPGGPPRLPFGSQPRK